ncbi:HIT family protein [Marinactinospora rubrisoli]|uniref:HIT family protein n=1 Tax=Marinactinospora rubrisoli TaxID=2715399 RepID=A0ABW2KNS9_9ACTN
MSCPFCAIVAGVAPATVIREWGDAIAIVPLNPVTPGHWLVIPRAHVRTAAESPAVYGAVSARAAELVSHTDANLITSIGSAATQTVDHLHVHIVPRTAGDGLALPWTGQGGVAR